MICEQCKRPVLFRLVGNGECVCRVCGRLHRIDDHLENEQQAAYVSRLEAAYADLAASAIWDRTYMAGSNASEHRIRAEKAAREALEKIRGEKE